MHISRLPLQSYTAPEKFISKLANNRKVNNFFANFENNENHFQNLLLFSVPAQQTWEAFVYTYGAAKDKNISNEQKYHTSSMFIMDAFYTALILIPLGLFINSRSKGWAEKILKPLKKYPDRFKYAKLGFRSFLTIGVIGVLSKRVLVPYFQTPSAKWFKEKYFMKHEDNPWINGLSHKKHGMYKNTPSLDNKPGRDNQFQGFENEFIKRPLE